MRANIAIYSNSELRYCYLIVINAEASLVEIKSLAVHYLCANFGLPRPLCSRLRPDVPDKQTSDDRQTDVRQHHNLPTGISGAGAY